MSKDVKHFLAKISLIAGFCVCASASANQFMGPDELAIRSVSRILSNLNNVLPQHVNVVLARLDKGKLQLEAPSNPYWVISSESGQILYYQGNPEFVGQSATRLVDDSGNRFGGKALENAMQDKNRWQLVTMGGIKYKVYCAHSAPHVVCTLMLPPKSTGPTKQNPG